MLSLVFDPDVQMSHVVGNPAENDDAGSGTRPLGRRRQVIRPPEPERARRELELPWNLERVVAVNQPELRVTRAQGSCSIVNRLAFGSITAAFSLVVEALRHRAWQYLRFGAPSRRGATLKPIEVAQDAADPSLSASLS